MTETTPKVETVNVTIDGQTIAVPKGSLLIEACRALDIDVPFFCWHPHMSPFGACRQCLVKVEKMPKPVASCTTQVADGMVVYASTDEVKQWREGIVGFLLANHPLECPTCDKGGECDLQNISFKHGPRHSLFRENKRHFIDYDMGPTVVRDMDRCIQCQRCIRFGLEWSGDHGIEFFGRGAATNIGTFARGPFLSKFSGNVTEVCPVGALTSEPFRLKARPWEMRSASVVCPHCAVGCNLTANTRQNELLRITGRENVQVNVCWTCDKGKFGVDFVNSDRRLKTPFYRRGDRLVPASWPEALTEVARRFQEIREADGPGAIGFIGSQKASNEDVFMFQRLAREGVGTANIDHRMGDTLPASLIPGTGLPLNDIARAKTIVLFAADVREETPVVWLRIHNAQLKGAKVIVIDERGSEADAFAQQSVRYRPGGETSFLRLLTAAVAQAAAGGSPPSEGDGAGVSVETLTQLANALKGGFVLLAGPRVAAKPDSAEIVRALWGLADAAPGARFGLLHLNNNTRGAYDMGAVPDHGPGWQQITHPGLNTAQMLQAAADGKLKALYVLGSDLVSSFPDAALVKKALETVPFLVVQDILTSEMSRQADVVLPGLSFAEREGTYTNLEGRIQASVKAVEPLGGGRPDWEICAALLAALGVAPGVLNVEDVTRQIAEAVPEYENAVPDRLPAEGALEVDERTTLAAPPPMGHAAAEGSAALPLILLTGPVLFDGGPLTTDTAAFSELEPSGYIDLAEPDAASAGIADGDMVTVSSEFGVVTVPAKVRGRVEPGTAFMPLKATGFRSNTLTSVTRTVQRVRIDKAQ
ncbi:MAG TPA: NADH-quinone oxidoreductase subunit NuoG [Armatimonadota bacterium]|jgi:NADH-quinone oxidoreductase subunit G